jgi:hypothetical protein
MIEFVAVLFVLLVLVAAIFSVTHYKRTALKTAKEQFIESIKWQSKKKELFPKILDVIENYDKKISNSH